jgi:hypothetical protein
MNVYFLYVKLDFPPKWIEPNKISKTNVYFYLKVYIELVKKSSKLVTKFVKIYRQVKREMVTIYI